ncbi:hypothetical protein [Caldilinea sp.]|jgi:hypothetical protein|uniref:hypothetical protein n=1 Tax=Caldilinea sp. TaxID=2293560 RepID=UPI001B174EA1|nr:hypothetical protein [Caldilinea sp.]MBO9392401.1 hypothetical protein [Caldilinea sp.]
MSTVLIRLQRFYATHRWFLILLLLFTTFRLFAIVLFRPGGFIADNSDYEFYYAWGLTIPMGYTTFIDLWTAYPPLFPALMLPVFEWSSRIPPWVEPRLFFHLLFGLELLLFEVGNLILIYRLARRLERAESQPFQRPGDVEARRETGSALAEQGAELSLPLRATLFYAMLFAPVYTLLGWFEAMPLFFLLLGLELLLSRRNGAWIVSALVAALGFLVKLTPMMLVPVAVRWLGARLSLDAMRTEWFNRRSPGNLLKPFLYGAVFLLAVIGVGLPLAHFNLPLAVSSFTVNNLRPPWQSVWALLDGYYGFGLVPIDMRNLRGLEQGGQWSSRLPWTGITLGFALLYLWLYTRRYDWERMRTPIAFTAVSVIWLFLYSKGWSPQFVVWVLAFLALLRPDMFGALLAVMLTLLNVLESSVYLILLPDERWILVTTVLARTALLITIAVDFLGQIWPQAQAGIRLQRVAVRLAASVMATTLVVVLVGAPHAAQAYQARRLAEHPCRQTIAFLLAEANGLTRTIAMEETELWRDLYPWLRQAYALVVIDGYNPEDRPFELVKAEKLAALAQQGEFWWIERTNGATEWAQAAMNFFVRPNVYRVDAQHLDSCKLVRVFVLEDAQPIGTFEATSGQIALRSVQLGEAKTGATLPLVLYWQAMTPIDEDYTVFTQLFAPNGHMIAQQDNPPMRGQAPTSAWHAGETVRDAYELAIPADAVPGEYTLHIGLYNQAGRLPVALQDGSIADHVTINVEVH